MILGIASGKEEALEVFMEIVDQVYRETGDVKVRDYFE